MFAKDKEESQNDRRTNIMWCYLNKVHRVVKVTETERIMGSPGAGEPLAKMKGLEMDGDGCTAVRCTLITG